MNAYQRLWATDPAAWRAAGAAWGGVVGLVDRHRAELAETTRRLRSDWSGTAAEAADQQLSHLTAKLAGSRPVFIEVDQVLAAHAANLARARALLTAAVERADAVGVQVDRHGRVALDPAAPRMAGQAGQTVREVAAHIGAALELAATTDRETTRRLTNLATAAGTGWTVDPGTDQPGTDQPGDRPPPDADPAMVHRWWDGLTPARQRWLLEHQPELLGRLDGIPAAVRDQANRLLLVEWRSTLSARRAELLADAQDPLTALALTRVDQLLAGLDAVADRLTTDAGPRGYLLGLDPTGDGRAIMAIGDPDHAEHVLTYVPGMMADLPGIGGELTRVDRMADRCATLAPGETTATVLWLDYDAPDFFDEAARESFARDAGPALHRFQEGLRASHEQPAAHHTVLGHSYGSLVVGAAARDHGLAADDLIFLGSPGVGVDHADELGLPPGRVWAGTARDDPIQYAALAPSELLERLAVGVAVPLAGPALAFGHPAEELWFGRNPVEPEFGAERLSAGTGGHVGYWAAGSPALDELARVILTGRPG